MRKQLLIAFGVLVLGSSVAFASPQESQSRFNQLPAPQYQQARQQQDQRSSAQRADRAQRNDSTYARTPTARALSRADTAPIAERKVSAGVAAASKGHAATTTRGSGGKRSSERGAAYVIVRRARTSRVGAAGGR